MEILGGLGAIELIILGIVLIVPFGLWLILFIDVLMNRFNGYEKLLWMVVVFLGSIPGAIVYLLFGRPRRISRTTQN